MKKIIFDEFVRLNRGFDLPESKIVDGEYPVVASTNIKAYHNAYKVKPPVVVTGRSGSLGKVQYIDIKCWPLNTSLYSKDFRGNNPKYIYYFLQTMHLEQYNAGAGVPTLNQNHLQRLKIVVHDIDEQKRIADILSAYDNLIENNNKRIKLLEQMAENLYKEWFVRFRFPGHEDVEFEDGIPDGWKRIKLRELINKSGSSIKKENLEVSYKYVPIDFINSKSIVLRKYDDLENASSSLQTFQENDILFGAMRPYFHKVSIADFKGVTRSTCFVIRPIDEDYLYYVLMMLFQESTVNFATTISVGSTMPYVRWEDFVRMNTLKPTKSVICDFSRKIVPVIKEMNILVVQNELLEKQRDLLLPRLMSGKLKV